MRWLLTSIGKTLALLGFYLGIRRAVTLENLSRALPHYSEQQRQQVARKSYLNLGRVFSELIYLRFAPLRSIEAATELINPETYHAALSKNNGLIVVAGHFANWEWLALGGSLKLKSVFSIVRKNIKTSGTELFLERMRKRSGNQLINAASTFSMIKVLKQGGCVAILADQAAPAEQTQVSFLGTTISAYEGPARLALATGASMLFASCVLTSSNTYRISFIPIEYDDSDSIMSLTQKHVSLLEEEIRARPELWLWQHKRWKNFQ